MKKAQIVEIAKQSFYIDQDAYTKLDKYLDDIQHHYDDVEIVTDIEISIAEKLSTRLHEGINVVTLVDVNEIIEQLGTVQDITEDEEPRKREKTDDSTSVQRRLFRSKKDAMLGGVAAGLAAYFNRDITLMRLIFVIVGLLSAGTAFAIYIILWLVTPEATTREEEQSMLGKPLTLKEIEETVKENAKEVREKHGPAFLSITERILQICVNVFKVIIQFTGLIVLICAIVSAVGVSIGIGGALLGGSSVTVFDGALVNFPSQPIDYVLAGAVWIILMTVFGFMAYFGATMLRLKSAFRASVVISMIVLFIMSVTAVGIVGVSQSQRYENLINTPQVSKSIKLEKFNKVSVQDSIQLRIVPATETKIEVSASESTIDKFSYDIQDGELTLKLDSTGTVCLFCGFRNIEVTLYTPDFDTLQVHNQTRASSTSALNIREIQASDQSSVSLDTLKTAKLHVQDQSSVKLSVTDSDMIQIDQHDQSSIRLKCQSVAGYSLVQTSQSSFDGSECQTKHASLNQQDQSHASIKTDDFQLIKSKDQASYKKL